MPADRALIVTEATRDDVATFVRWAAAEGWNPGRGDLDPFLVPDPHGFLVGRLAGEAEPAASVSFVRYSPTYAFLGFYIVRPEFRGQGHGIAIWRAAMARAEGRTVGLDGVPDQQANYRKSGFVLARQNARYVGSIDDAAAAGTADTVDLRSVPIDELADYDRRTYPAPRAPFLQAWLAPADRHGRAIRDGSGGIAGYGVIRPSEDGRRVGPLFADDPATAERLLLALAGTGTGPIAIDMPLPNTAAVRIAEGLGLEPSFETARMYAGTPPVEPVERIFGVSSLELG
jgi:GNAT superfamily N-acetyltransferase